MYLKEEASDIDGTGMGQRETDHPGELEMLCYAPYHVKVLGMHEFSSHNVPSFSLARQSSTNNLSLPQLCD